MPNLRMLAYRMPTWQPWWYPGIPQSSCAEGRVVSSDANKPFLHNPPKSSIFALACHDAFLLSIFFLSLPRVCRRKPTFSRRANFSSFYIDVLNPYFFLFIYFFFLLEVGHQPPGCAVKVECIRPPFKGWGPHCEVNFSLFYKCSSPFLTSRVERLTCGSDN